MATVRESVESLGEEGGGAWPAFADLLAASTLIFLVFFATIAIPALRRAKALEDQVIAQARIVNGVQKWIRDSGHEQVLRASRVGSYVLVEITGNATFPQDQYELSRLAEQGKQILRDFGAYLSQAVLDTVDQIQVVGHASSEGSPVLNWRLSSNRAATVALFLIDTVGIDPCKVSALGRSYYYPKDPARAVPGEAADRRIELEIHPTVKGDVEQETRRNACRPGRR